MVSNKSINGVLKSFDLEVYKCKDLDFKFHINNCLLKIVIASLKVYMPKLMTEFLIQLYT